MNIENAKDQITALLQKAISLSDEIGIGLSLTVVRKEDYRDSWVSVGDYDLWNRHNDDPHWEYVPIHQIDDWKSPVERSLIISFTLPPKEKCPADSATEQGKSIDDIARNHLTISEDEMQ